MSNIRDDSLFFSILTNPIEDHIRRVQETFIVVRKRDDGGLAPAVKPCVHKTRADAEKEAARLAEGHPGKSFMVFRQVSSAKAPKPQATITRH